MRDLNDLILYEDVVTDENISDDLFQEAVMFLEVSNANLNTHIMAEFLIPKVDPVLSTPLGDRNFRQLVGNYIDRNNEKLHASGPMDLIPFTDKDKILFYDLFHIGYTVGKRGSKVTVDCEIVNYAKEITSKITDKSSFKLLTDNPIFWLFYFCIRYYGMHKNTQGLNCALAIYALAVYPSIFSKYFKYGVSQPGVMLYTVDQLTSKYILKQEGSIFGALLKSITNSYSSSKHKPYFPDAEDKEIIKWIQRIRNDQNSMIKNIRNQYEINYRKGNRIAAQKDTYDDNAIIDDVESNTSIVESITNSVSLKILTNGVDPIRAQNCAKMSEISVVDVRMYLSLILIDKYTEDIRGMVEAIIYIFLYEEGHKPEEINSKNYLVWGAKLFRKTNSNDPNIVKIKTLLEKWCKEIGVHDKFKREASRINYKKAIFYYFLISIQAYNK